MSKKNNKAAKKARHKALIEAEKREEQEREEKRAKNAKRKERQQAAMAVDVAEAEPMPAKRRRLMPKEMKIHARDEGAMEEEEEHRFVAVGGMEAMEGVEITADPKPNNVIVTLGFDELKNTNRSSNASKAALAARIRSGNRLKRVRSKSKLVSEAENSAMQM